MADQEQVEFERDADVLRGTVFRPTGPSSGGVVVVPSVHGCNDYVREVGATLAAGGYTSMVFDIYSRGDGPGDLTSPANIQAAIAALPDERLTDDVVAAGRYLRDDTAGNVAVLGFCIGGAYAFLAAGSDAFAAAVVFYGMIRYAPGIAESKDHHPIDRVEQVQVPLLAHFGTIDPWCPAEHVAELRERLTSAGKPHEVYEYPGAGHAFHEFHRPQVYRPVAAADAWRRSMAFIDYHVGGVHA